MVGPLLTLWTLEGPPDDSSETSEPPPLPPKPSAEEQVRATTGFHSGHQFELEVSDDDEEFFEIQSADIEDDSNQNPIPEKSRPASPPPTNATAALRRILNGKRHTATFPGTSQYAQGGSSACGLTSMNAVRLAFELYSNIRDKEALISALIGEEYVKNAMKIASFWSNEIHLEVDSIMELPLFTRTLRLTAERYCEVRWRTFSDTVVELCSDDGPPCPRAALLTRPPEMISIIYIPIPPLPNDKSKRSRSFYIIFDSHPRPSHPDGTALEIFPALSTDVIADYLADLFQIDTDLMNDPTLQWHVQLLGQVSCHFFAPVDEQEPSNEYSMNMSFLKLKQQALETKRKLDASEKEKRQLQSRVFDLQQEIGWLSSTERKRHEETRRQSPSQATDKRSQRNDRDSGWAWNVPLKRNAKGKDREAQPPRADPGQHPNPNYSKNFSDNTHWPKPQAKAPSTSPTSSRTRTKPLLTPGPSSPRSQNTDAEQIEFTRSLELARALQEEFDNERVAFDRDQSLAQAYERPTFDCAICMESFTDEAIASVDGCNHSCCRECMRRHVQSKIDERRYPIPCPFCATGNDEKGQKKANTGFIPPSLVETIGITPEQYTIYVELQLAEYSIMIDCRKCSQSAFVDRKDFDLTEVITCPMPRCTHTWCKQCNQSIEGGAKHSCDGSAELETLMNQRGWKHCPGCRTPIERSAGCNHMTCYTPGCNMHFCYICGGTVIRGGTRNEIQAAVAGHFRSCTLFDVPRER